MNRFYRFAGFASIEHPLIKRSVGVLLAMTALLVFLPAAHAQTTATLSGTVQDPSAAVIPGATVTLVNEATQDMRVAPANANGFFAFPSLVPGSYTIKVAAKGFSGKDLTGVILHAGDQRTVPSIVLAVGAASQTVTVQAASQIIPMTNGERSDVLSYKDIQNIDLEGRDTTELLKVLPGVTNASSGISNGPAYNDIMVSAGQSALGEGLNVNGAPNRGGSALLSDGVNINDPGCNCTAISLVDPDMVQEVSVLTSNFGADSEFGPVVVSAISKSGTDQYHGEAYFDARNDALNANDWASNHQGIPKAGAYYYYPGGNVGGPVPHTNKKLFFWGGYERFLQNQGNANVLQSYIPSPEMMAGDFTSDNPDNVALCPNGFSSTAQGNWCNNLSGTILPDGTTVTNGKIPAQWLNAGAKSLSSFWPKANANPLTTPGAYNYYQPIINVNDGWVWRARMDYDLSDKTKIYVSYQQGYSAQLANGNGAHIYWTPANAIPYPGGGLHSYSHTRAAAGHFVHIFSPTATNEFIASWGYGYFPTAPPNASGAFRTTLNYPTGAGYGTVFNGGSKLIPSYAANYQAQTFPDFSNPDIFEPAGIYQVRKEIPGFNDNFTKVWGSHTVKIGAFTENVGNFQGMFGNLNGSLNNFNGQEPDAITGQMTGSPNNPTANFVMGSATSYSEANSSPNSDMAYQILSFYVDDSWKVSDKLSVQYGARIEHVGHWYDRQGVGMAVFYPDRVVSDYYSGKIDPGMYWHGISSGIPNSGMPNRLAFVSPRFGMSYDLFGTGKTLLRGGWGAYRWAGQYNDYSAALQTAQNVQTYGLPGQTSVLLSQIGLLKSPVGAPPGTGTTGTQNALDPTDYGIPLTYAYNLTVDQQLPWNSVFEVAYVGSSSSEINDNGQAINGAGNAAYANQNKTPIGAFFKADPRTGLIATNPENLATTCPAGVKAGSASCNQPADYRPYGVEYGTNGIEMDQSIGYSNYNGLQASWMKSAGRLIFDLNGTWSRTLTSSAFQVNPFVLSQNLGPASIDRPYVFNSSYIYQAGDILHSGNKAIREAVNGWTISGISSWQSGGNLQTLNSPNFNLSESYINIPASAVAAGVTPAIGGNTYYGTDAGLAIMPVLTCNPNKGLAYNQRVQLKCFSAPAVGTQGGKNYPYMSMNAFIENDLALYKTFLIKGSQNVQFRFSAFNWLNHPLPQFSSGNQLKLYYNVDYATKAIALNTGPGGTVPNFGYMDTKDGTPNQRIIELNVKYNF
ncbi:MAG: carboxypeptidase-like regulatory domain-containing protein [Acidobacteriaceae bacterium]